MQSFWTKHIENNPPARTEVYELKFTRENRIPFSSLAVHQADALIKVVIGSYYHRITDQPWLPDRKWAFTAKKPFDCFVIAHAEAFVVLWFYRPREEKIFIKIPIRKWIDAEQHHDKKSLSYEEALSIGEPVKI